MPPTVDSILKEAVAGDAEALSSLLCQYGPVIQKRLHIAPQWQSMIDPDDVMQVTYLEAFIQIRRFDPTRGTSFEGWLHHIAQNNLRDAIRGLSRQKHPQPRDRVATITGDSSVELLNLLGVASATPSREAGRDEIARILDQAVGCLPADYAAVIRLYDLQCKSIDEVGSTMKRSPGAVHMLRARAHDALRERLGSESKFFSTPA